jgi:hypothetical protein
MWLGELFTRHLKNLQYHEILHGNSDLICRVAAMTGDFELTDSLIHSLAHSVALEPAGSSPHSQQPATSL